MTFLLIRECPHVCTCRGTIEGYINPDGTGDGNYIVRRHSEAGLIEQGEGGPGQSPRPEGTAPSPADRLRKWVPS